MICQTVLKPFFHLLHSRTGGPPCEGWKWNSRSQRNAPLWVTLQFHMENLDTFDYSLKTGFSRWMYGRAMGSHTGVKNLTFCSPFLLDCIGFWRVFTPLYLGPSSPNCKTSHSQQFPEFRQILVKMSCWYNKVCGRRCAPNVIKQIVTKPTSCFGVIKSSWVFWGLLRERRSWFPTPKFTLPMRLF